MKRLVTFAVTALLASPLVGQPLEDFGSIATADVIETAPSAHPATLYMLSARLLEEGNEFAAAKWMYAGQLRYRFMIETLDDGATDERALFAALTESVGRPVNEYIAGDPDAWIAAMEWALNWDAAHENAFTSETEFASQLSEVRSGLEDLIRDVDANRDQIRDAREANGLPNR